MFTIKPRQWWGLVFGIIISILIWAKMVFIVAPAKNHEQKFTLGYYEYMALVISLLIALASWLKLVSIVG